MKFFSLILALYFLGLTLVPCSDYDTNDPIGSEQISLISDEDHSHHHDHDDSQDDCSPLCYCQCCQVSIVLNSKILLFESEDNRDQNLTFYLGEMPNSSVETLLRPPRA